MFFRLSTAWYTAWAAAITCDTNKKALTLSCCELNLSTNEVINHTSFSLWNRSFKSWEFGANNFSTKAAGMLVFIWSTIYNHTRKNVWKSISKTKIVTRSRCELHLCKSHKFSSSLLIIGLIKSSPTSVSRVRTDMLYSSPQHWQLSSWFRP